MVDAESGGELWSGGPRVDQERKGIRPWLPSRTRRLQIVPPDQKGVSHSGCSEFRTLRPASLPFSTSRLLSPTRQKWTRSTGVQAIFSWASSTGSGAPSCAGQLCNRSTGVDGALILARSEITWHRVCCLADQDADLLGTHGGSALQDQSHHA